MIIKLDKDGASTEGMSDYIFDYDENRFIFLPYQRKKVRFITSHKALHFLDRLRLGIWDNRDVLIWYKKQ